MAALEITLEEQEQQLKNANLPEIRRRKEAIQNIIAAVEKAKEQLSALEKERIRVQKAKNDIAGYVKEIDALKQQLDILRPQIHDAEITANAKKEMLDKQRESIEDWAKNIRTKLHIGETCPVCRQKIQSEIPHEEELDSLFATFESAWKEADKLVNKLKDKEKGINAEIKSYTQICEKAKKNLICDTTLSECESAVKSACKKCGVETIGCHTMDELNRMHDEATTALYGIEKQISTAETLDKNAQSNRSLIGKERKQTETARQAVADIEGIIKECEARITSSNKLIKLKTEEINIASKKVEKWLADSLWQNDWKKDMPEFAHELNSATKVYGNNKNRQLNLEQEIREQKISTDNVTENLKAIIALMPEWEAIKISNIHEIRNLQRETNDLRAKVNSTIEQMKKNISSANEAMQHLNEYYERNESLLPARLSELESYSIDNIATISKEITDKHNIQLQKKTILEQLTKQKEEHENKKPALSIEDNAEGLIVHLSSLDRQIDNLVEQKSVFNLQLQQNAEEKKRQKILFEDVNAKKKEYEKWSRINQLIGDATGNKFRKIAQSYVLTTLIHSANSYMRTLTDRYTLKVTSGTFVIMLEDAYQGFVSRAASTISGGEGFLVSLALALALSDIGQTLSVDTLFIDEGFGTLSGEPLQNAVNTLRTLHTKGDRHVGIISHVEELQERIPVQIQIKQEGNQSSSKVNIVCSKA